MYHTSAIYARAGSHIYSTGARCVGWLARKGRPGRHAGWLGSEAGRWAGEEVRRDGEEGVDAHAECCWWRGANVYYADAASGRAVSCTHVGGDGGGGGVTVRVRRYCSLRYRTILTVAVLTSCCWSRRRTRRTGQAGRRWRCGPTRAAAPSSAGTRCRTYYDYTHLVPPGYVLWLY